MHLQIHLVWPERLQAQIKSSCAPFSIVLYVSLFVALQKGRPRPLIAAVELTCGTKPRGKGGAPIWEGDPHGCPGAGMGWRGGAPSLWSNVWLYMWMALAFGGPSTGKGL